ncbi:MAG: PIN domain-containing protein [Opitutaceae bacterium]|jgi:tRNA(fMet)-specific endonuclease VapC|nr:PIN domain-containing protein [Opitutaceae bacterium]
MKERLYLPDTNVFSTYAKGENTGLVNRVLDATESLVLSSVTLAEMEYGWQKAPVETRRIARQKELAKRLVPRPFDETCAYAYGLIKSYLLHGRIKTRGNANPIGERDMLIASHAFALRAVLVTHNTREFAGIPGLDVEDWEA